MEDAEARCRRRPAVRGGATAEVYLSDHRRARGAERADAEFLRFGGAGLVLAPHEAIHHRLVARVHGVVVLRLHPVSEPARHGHARRGVGGGRAEAEIGRRSGGDRAEIGGGRADAPLRTARPDRRPLWPPPSKSLTSGSLTSGSLTSKSLTSGSLTSRSLTSRSRSSRRARAEACAEACAGGGLTGRRGRRHVRGPARLAKHPVSRKVAVLRLPLGGGGGGRLVVVRVEVYEKGVGRDPEAGALGGQLICGRGARGWEVQEG